MRSHFRGMLLVVPLMESIQGTPGVIIGNQLVPGILPYERLVQLVEEAKNQSGAGVVGAPGKQASLSK